jgi:hypothetical protein
VARLLRQLAQDPERLDALRDTLRSPPATVTEQHIAVYATLLGKPLGTAKNASPAH